MPPILELDESLFLPSETTPKKIKSLVNKKYDSHLDAVREIIAQNNRQYIEDQKRVADLIVKGSSNVSNDKDFSEFFEIVKEMKDEKANIDVLTVTLISSMNKIKPNELYAQTIHLSDVKKTKSIKVYNILINLSKIWDLIEESYKNTDELISKSAVPYVLSVIKILASIKKLSTINFSQSEAIVLSTIYSYGGHASKDQIFNRIVQSKLLNHEQFSTDENFSSILQRLEDIKTIEIKDNEYYLIEEIII